MIKKNIVYVPFVFLNRNDINVCFSAVWVWRPCPINVSLPYPPLDNIRVMVIVWRLRGNIITTVLCWVV